MFLPLNENHYEKNNDKKINQGFKTLFQKVLVPITQRLVSKCAPNKSPGSGPQPAGSPAVAGRHSHPSASLCPKGEARPGHCGVRSYRGQDSIPG